MKKLINSILMLLCTLPLITSCDKDGENIYLRGFESSDLIASSESVSLGISNSNAVVLSFAWQNPTILSSSSSEPAADGVLSTLIEVSADENFSTYKELAADNLSKAFFGSELNAMAKDLNMASDVSSPMYFRIKGVLGANLPAKYSNVCMVKVTPFTIQMNSLSVLNKEKTDTLTTLYSPTENGIYTGFMAANAWSNCWFQENDGKIWGNYGVDGHVFELSSASDSWNCWFGDNSGHWYVTVDTKTEQWIGVGITTMKVNGDAMTYNASNSTFTYVITTTTPNTAISIDADALEFNKTTGDAKSGATPKTLNFAINGDKMDLSDSSTPTTIANAGTYTITLSLNDAASYDIDITEGAVTPPSGPGIELPTTLYMYTIDQTTQIGQLDKVSDGVYSCNYVTTATWENFRLYDQEHDVWYGSDPANQYGLSSTAGFYNIWLNDDFTAGDIVKITANLNTLTWSYEI